MTFSVGFNESLRNKLCYLIAVVLCWLNSHLMPVNVTVHHPDSWIGFGKPYHCRTEVSKENYSMRNKEKKRRGERRKACRLCISRLQKKSSTLR